MIMHDGLNQDTESTQSQGQLREFLLLQNR